MKISLGGWLYRNDIITPGWKYREIFHDIFTPGWKYRGVKIMSYTGFDVHRLLELTQSPTRVQFITCMVQGSCAVKFIFEFGCDVLLDDDNHSWKYKMLSLFQFFMPGEGFQWVGDRSWFRSFVGNLLSLIC